MSKKRMMSKQQRLYYEHQKKERVRQELAEYAKQLHEFEAKKDYNREYGYILERINT